MRYFIFFILASVVFHTGSVSSAEMNHGNHSMTLDTNGMVMNENEDQIPPGCEGRVEAVEFKIVADSEGSKEFPGTVFSFSPRVFNVEPCSKISVVFENKDDVRHQWMVHGLPKFIYTAGMFHLEAFAGKTVSGTFIVPAEDKSYLVHCDISQHMQKGMKGMLVVGKGSGVISGIPGVSGHFFSGGKGFISIFWVFGFGLFFLVVALLVRGSKRSG